MRELDLTYLCTVIADLAGMPVRVYKGDTLTFFRFSAPLPKDPIQPHLPRILNAKESIGYFTTDMLDSYGFISHKDQKVVIGPSRQIPYTLQELHTLAFYLDVPPDETDIFISSMKSIVRMPFESILQILCVMNYVENGEKRSIQNIQITGAEQEQLKAAMEHLDGRRMFHPEDTDYGPAGQAYNTRAIEETLMNMVSRGDVAALREWLSQAPAVRGGVLAAEQLRQQKNLFIVTATLVCRAAIRGGLDDQEAFSLSDQFIQSCEQLNAPERIINLQQHMVMEFTQRVQRIFLGHAPSQLTVQVSNYIRHHLSESIRIENIAKELYMSRPYLSKKFAEETGQTLTDFIMQKKTEEAKRLLRYTDKTATAIGTYLGFSSQSHFSRVFQKYTGRTPKEYRQRHRSQQGVSQESS